MNETGGEHGQNEGSQKQNAFQMPLLANGSLNDIKKVLYHVSKLRPRVLPGGIYNLFWKTLALHVWALDDVCQVLCRHCIANNLGQLSSLTFLQDDRTSCQQQASSWHIHDAFDCELR